MRWGRRIRKRKGWKTNSEDFGFTRQQRGRNSADLASFFFHFLLSSTHHSGRRSFRYLWLKWHLSKWLSSFFFICFYFVCVPYLLFALWRRRRVTFSRMEESRVLDTMPNFRRARDGVVWFAPSPTPFDDNSKYSCGRAASFIAPILLCLLVAFERGRYSSDSLFIPDGLLPQRSPLVGFC